MRSKNHVRAPPARKHEIFANSDQQRLKLYAGDHQEFDLWFEDEAEFQIQNGQTEIRLRVINRRENKKQNRIALKISTSVVASFLVWVIVKIFGG